MNKIQENKRTMYEAILALMTANAAKIAAMPAFAASETSFRNVVAQIEGKSQEYNHATTGKVNVKREAEAALITETLAMAAALFAYARKQKNAELKAKATVTESVLRLMRDTERVTQANAILGLVNANLQALADYGITQEKATAYQGKIAVFAAAVGGRESSIAERAGARTSLVDLFRQADELLREELDRCMELLRATEQQFYTEYFAARIVKDLGLRHRQPTNGTQPAPVPA